MSTDPNRHPAAPGDDVLRRSFAAAPVGMAIISAEPPRYVEVNAAFASFLGRTREEILAADPYVFWAQITHPDDFVLEQPQLARLVAGEIDSFQIRKRFIRANGEIRWGLLSFSAVRGAGGALAYGIGQVADVHDRVLDEERTRQSQKMAALGQLAGGIAHDFNNLLTVIMGYADLLKTRAGGDTVAHDFAAQVLDSASHGAELTRQLLAYSRRQLLVPRVFSVNQSVSGVCDLVGRLLGEQIKFARRLESAGHIQADPGQIEQVVMNLILNGRDALPNGGKLTVETDDVEVTDAAPPPHADLGPGSYVRITVSDDGVGMSDSVRAQIFEPFFTTKEQGKGTGLGLSTVWGIVQQSGGAIGVTSAPGAGTRFEVYFRRVEPRPEPAARETTAERRQRSATILLAEDNPAVRMLMAEVLRSAGYTVMPAETAERAHQIADTTPIDLVISDMVMPQRSGLALIQELRRARPALPALVVSGYSEEAATLAESLAEAHYLFKPFVPAVLLERVRDILS